MVKTIWRFFMCGMKVSPTDMKDIRRRRIEKLPEYDKYIRNKNDGL